MANLKNSKKCPNCKYTECWINANDCERCGYDFIRNKVPTTIPQPEVKVEEEEEIILPPEEKPPEKLNKDCPNCYNVCWWKAPTCEKCDYNFKTGKYPPKKHNEPSNRDSALVIEYKTKVAVHKGNSQYEMLTLSDAIKFKLEQEKLYKHYLFFSNTNGECFSLRLMPPGWNAFSISSKKDYLSSIEYFAGKVQKIVKIGNLQFYDDTVRDLVD